MMYDLLLRNGRVIDPEQNLDGVYDIAIAAGKIAAIAPPTGPTAIAPEDAPTMARRILDLSGKIITSGLIDVHMHVADQEESVNAEADSVGVNMAVTTVVDAGTAGVLSFPAFHRLVQGRSPKTRVLFIVRMAQLYNFGGFISLKVGADLSPDNYTLRPAAKLFERYRDCIVGFKCTAPLLQASDTESIPLNCSKAITRELNLPLMVHLGWVPFTPWLDTPSILAKLDGGDIATHIFRRKGTILDANQRVCPEVFAAQERGVVFDIGHGTGSFDFEVAKRAIDQGICPHTISSDVMDKSSITGPVFSLTETMTKFLYLGFSLPDVIAMTTGNSARAINRQDELGSLAVGRVADLSILDYRDGQWKLGDGVNVVHWQGRKLIPHLTVRAGEIMACQYPANSLRRDELSAPALAAL